MTIGNNKLHADESLCAFMRKYDYSPEKTLVIKVAWFVSVKIQGPGTPRHLCKFQPHRNWEHVANVVAMLNRNRSRNTVTTEQLRLTAGDESLLPPSHPECRP
eukprot:COSAG02_NODE_32838_length_509_cov_1.941463_1_plen_102_part_10